jgi:CO/xanthine dehydrogenase FAD-binding subunit
LSAHQRSSFAKLGVRASVTVSKLSAAVVVDHDPASGVLSNARVALGSVAPVAFRDAALEALLQGQVADRRLAQRFANACADAVQRSIPSRQSLDYKRYAAMGVAYDAWNALALCEPCEPSEALPR